MWLVFGGLVLVVAALLTYIYATFRRSYTYFRQRNIPYLEPQFPLGNTHDSVLRVRHFGIVSQTYYAQLKALGDYGGVFLLSQPMLIVLSPEFAKTVMVRDFQYFVDRGVYYNKESDPLSGNLFFIEGDEWRLLRAKITLTFTSGKMKTMFHTIREVADRLTEFMATTVAADDADVNIREYLARFTTDVIGSCAFGLECDSIRNPQSEFRELGKKMFNVTRVQSLKLFLSMLMRKQARWLGVQFNSDEVIDSVMRLVRQMIAYRRENNVRRNDFMQLMIDLQETEDADGGLSVEEIAAQSFVFFFAGFETSSTTLTYAMYELAMNPDIQEKLRAEIDTAVPNVNDNFTYEQIMGMGYMDRVIAETLRKYPVIATIHRVVDKPYTMPNGSTLTPGTFVVIPTYAFHHDPELFPQPDRFDPDRFLEAAKSKRHPYAYLPFGEGPRQCIGMRFGLLQVKVGLAALLRQFRFEVSDRTEIPVNVDQLNMLYVPLEGVWLRVTKYVR